VAVIESWVVIEKLGITLMPMVTSSMDALYGNRAALVIKSLVVVERRAFISFNICVCVE
jgi:hypothetical protein